MSWCEENRVEYVFGLARNRRLVGTLGPTPSLTRPEPR